MKRLTIMIMIALIASTATAKSTLKWDAVPGDVEGYKIYYNEYSKAVGNVTQYPLKDLNLVPGTEYTIAVTAYNHCGESERSDPVIHKEPIFEIADNPAPVVIQIPESVGNVTINFVKSD